MEVHASPVDPYPLPSPVWVDPYHFSDGHPIARLSFKDDHPVLDTPGTGAFTLHPHRIDYFARGEDPAPVPYLLGRVFALYLELAGFPLLHGGAFVHAGGTAGLLGDSGTGKSTLAAALAASGTRLLTDDLIPLHLEAGRPVIYPGIPMSRIWPDTGAAFVANFADAARIHPLGQKRKVFDDGRGGARFADTPQALTDLFVLERVSDSDAVRVQRLAPAAALMELVRLSYRPELVQTLGLQQRRMPIMAQTLAHVRVHRLTYPSGFDHVPAVCAALHAATVQSAG